MPTEKNIYIEIVNGYIPFRREKNMRDTSNKYINQT